MTWTYSGDPSASPKDQFRFIIGDTDELVPQITDEEIAFLLEQNENEPLRAAVAACDVLIAKYSQYVDYTIGPESVKAGERAKAFAALKALLKGKLSAANEAPTFGQSFTGEIFDIGMHDNKNAVYPFAWLKLYG